MITQQASVQLLLRYKFVFYFLSDKVMYFYLLFPFTLLSYITQVSAVSVHINVTSQFSFQNKILKAQVTTLNGIQFLYLLFDNGTISKLDAQLNFIDRIKTLDNKKMTDFSIANNNYYTTNSPSLFALIQGGIQWRVISLQNTSIQFNFNTPGSMTFAFGQGVYFNATTIIKLRAVIYHSDVMQHIQILSGVLSTKASRNFTQYYHTFISYNFLRVVHVKYQSRDYLMSVTTNYIVCSYDVSGLSFIYSDRPITFKDPEDIFYDKESIAIVRHTDNSQYEKNTITKASVGLSLHTLGKVFGSVLKGIRPRYDMDGERIFIYQMKTVRLNLTAANSWEWVGQVQTAIPFNFTSKVGFAVFSTTSSSFTYQLNSSKVYGYCESLLNGKCTSNVVLPCTVKFPFCQKCNANYTICTQCMDSYIIMNNRCVQTSTSCIVQKCILCFLSNTCLQCDIDYNLNSTTNQCISTLSPPPFPSNTTNNNATNNNATNNNTTNNNTTSNNTTSNNTTSNNTIGNNTNSATNNTTNNTNSSFPHSAPGNAPIYSFDIPTFNNQTSSNATDSNSSTNQTSNDSSNSTTTNLTDNDSDSFLPQFPLNAEQKFMFKKDSIIQRYESYNPSVKNIALISSIMNSSPLYRMLFGFLAPIFGLFDDYWYYIYHKNNWKKLIFFPDILVFMYIVNQQRILPDYLRFSESLTISAFNHSRYLENYTNQRILQIDQQKTYTQQNFQEMLLQQFPFLILTFICIKLVTIVIKCCLKNKRPSKEILKQQKSGKQANSTKSANQKGSFFKSLNNYLMDCVSFRSVILTLFGSNLIYISFQISCQLRSAFAFQFIDSVNLVLAVMFGFLFVILFIILLSLVHVVSHSIKVSISDNVEIMEAKKRQSLQIKYSDMNTVAFNGVKCVLYGFIHGFFIEQNELQYVMLIIVKIGLLVINVRCSYLFEHQFLSVTSFIYYFTGVLIDTLCLIQKMRITPVDLLKQVFYGYSILNLIEFSLFVILIGVVITGVIFQFVRDLRMSLCPKTRNEKMLMQIKTSNFLSVFNRVIPIDNPNQGLVSKISKNIFEDVTHKQQNINQLSCPKFSYHRKIILNESAKRKKPESFVKKFKILRFQKDLIENRTKDQDELNSEDYVLPTAQENTTSRCAVERQRKILNSDILMNFKSRASKNEEYIKDENTQNNRMILNKLQRIRGKKKVYQTLGIKINVIARGYSVQNRYKKQQQ